jgi:hypothetical protein
MNKTTHHSERGRRLPYHFGCGSAAVCEDRIDPAPGEAHHHAAAKAAAAAGDDGYLVRWVGAVSLRHLLVLSGDWP